MKNRLFLFAVLVCFSIKAQAQRFCIMDELEQRAISTQPAVLKHKQDNTIKWQRFDKLVDMAKLVISGTDTVYEIPTVVHIMHAGKPLGSEENPTDLSIDSMIYFLNKVWAAEWPTFVDTLSGGVRFPIRFTLAKRDPSCNPTTGVNRVDASGVSGYSSYGICPFGLYPGPSDNALKSLSKWPGTDYYNIWIVNKIEENSAEAYAPWPWYLDTGFVDGIVIAAKYIGRQASTGDFRFTIAHEMGHGFGLYHTFQGGCHPVSSCLTMGDELCDTEPHNFPGYFDCFEGETNSCTGLTYAGVEHNFMNYSTCPNRFTKDQRTRVVYTLKNYRMGLVYAQSGLAPDTGFVKPIAACEPSIINPSSGLDAGAHEIHLGDWRTTSLGYLADGKYIYVDRTCAQDPAYLEEGKSYTFSVQTRNAAQYVQAWIDYNNDGVFQSSEQIYTHTGSMVDELHSGIVIVPASGVETMKFLRMRVIADTQPITDACSALQDGQAEDYAVWIDKTSSVEEWGSLEQIIKVYPNPAKDRLWIESPQPMDLVLYAVDGRKLLSANAASSIDCSVLSNGVYWLSLTDPKGKVPQTNKKVVINK